MRSTREQTGWYFYDFANSAFSTTGVALLLGPYITAVAQGAADARGMIHPLGIPVYAGSYWGYLVALAVMLQVLVLPVLGSLADYSPRKKRLLALFAYSGAAANAAMFFIRPGMYLAGGGLFLFANLAFGASVVVYNSFLPEIASEAERDAVSSKGWGLGFLGGGLLLALNLALFQAAPRFGISEPLAVRINLASAGVWWAAFTLIPLATLKDREPLQRLPVSAGIRNLIKTLRGLRGYPQTLKFLLAYLIYNDAIQTVITMAAPFASEELHVPIATLSLLILMVQFVAFGGALLFGWIARWTGAKRAVMASLVIWSAVLIAIYALVHTTPQLFAVGAVIAIVLGGSQALSRSLYSQMIPKGKEAEYFSLYEISDKGTSWLGPLVFGLALQTTKSYRVAILSLIVFFVAGLLVLARVNVRRAAAEAAR